MVLDKMINPISDLLKLKPLVKNAMRKATPRDTGNLAFNALAIYPQNTGLKTVYRGNIAGYGKILNQSLILGSNSKNKHFAWHSRAVSNAINVVARYYNPKAKGFRMYNNRQVSYKERSDANISTMGSLLEQTNRNVKSESYKEFVSDTRQEAQSHILKQEYKWKMNQAKASFEKTNPMG